MKALKKLARKAIATLKRKAPKIMYAAPRSIPGLSGLAMVSLGIAFLNLPAGIIAGGICLLWLDARL